MRKKPIGIGPMKSVGGLLCRRTCKNDMSRVHLDKGPVSVHVIEPCKNMNTPDINEVGTRTHYRLLPTEADHQKASRSGYDDTYGPPNK